MTCHGTPNRSIAERVELAAAYDRTFFLEYGASNRAYAGACRTIAEELHRRFEPESAVDWGCGAGLHAAALAALGVRVTGVDGVDVDADLCAPGVPYVMADLRHPIHTTSIPARYDLALCLDVMEHLAEEHADQALESITAGADLVILSCAPPGQGGHHHVNEQPRRYWVKKMRDIGWAYDRRETGALEGAFLAMSPRPRWSWMYHNLCVYRRHG